jgi:hypothetical protein
MVTTGGTTELPVAATGKVGDIYQRPVIVGADGKRYFVSHVGQSQPSVDTGAAAAFLGLFAGLMIASLAIEAIPGAMIAHYGYHLGWAPSIGIGIGSAIGFNMIVGLLQGPGAPAGATLQPA